MPTRSISSCVKNYNSVIALKTSETEFARSKVQHRKKAEGMITWQKQDTPEIFYDNESGRSEEKGSQETLQTKQESSVTAKKLDGNQRNTEITCTSSQKKLPKILRNSDEEIRCQKQSTDGNEHGNGKSSGQNGNEHEDPKTESQSEPNAGQ